MSRAWHRAGTKGAHGVWLEGLCMPSRGERVSSYDPTDTEARPREKQGLQKVTGGPAPPGQPLLYGLDPLVALLSAGGRDPVRLVLALHHLAVAVRLAGLDLLAPAAGVVELQTELWRRQVRAGQGTPEGPAALGPGGTSDRTGPLGKASAGTSSRTHPPRPASRERQGTRAPHERTDCGPGSP